MCPWSYVIAHIRHEIFRVLSCSCTFVFRVSKIKTYIHFFRVVSFHVSVLHVKLSGLVIADRGAFFELFKYFMHISYT